MRQTVAMTQFNVGPRPVPHFGPDAVRFAASSDEEANKPRRPTEPANEIGIQLGSTCLFR
jgi:hypothetical protein